MYSIENKYIDVIKKEIKKKKNSALEVYFENKCINSENPISYPSIAYSIDEYFSNFDKYCSVSLPTSKNLFPINNETIELIRIIKIFFLIVISSYQFSSTINANFFKKKFRNKQ